MKNNLIDHNNDVQAILGVLAHDIKSPLMAIENASFLLEEQIQKRDWERSQQYLDQFKKSIASLSLVSSTILDYLWISTAEKSYITLHQIFKNIQIVIGPYAEMCKITISLPCEKTDQSKLQNKYDDRLEILIRNVCTNIIKHSGAKNIFLDFYQEGNQTIITIEDDAQSMSNEVYDYINYVIRKSNTKKVEMKSQGLGLLIIRKYLKELNLEFCLERNNKGNVFKIIKNDDVYEVSDRVKVGKKTNILTKGKNGDSLLNH